MDWQIGDRVLANWAGERVWYPATIQSLAGGQFQLLYDDGSTEWTTLAQGQFFRLGAYDPRGPEVTASPLQDVQVGDRVDCRWLGGNVFYPGSVTERAGDKIHVRYDDGDEEWTSLAMCRLPPGAVTQAAETASPDASVAWRIGERVLAHFAHDGFWYPGTILKIDDTRLYVRFDNGTKQWTPPARLLELDLEVGDRVSCRRPGASALQAGRIVQCDGDKILVRFDDGGEEWVSLELCCVTR